MPSRMPAMWDRKPEDVLNFEQPVNGVPATEEQIQARKNLYDFLCDECRTRPLWHKWYQILRPAHRVPFRGCFCCLEEGDFQKLQGLLRVMPKGDLGWLNPYCAFQGHYSPPFQYLKQVDWIPGWYHVDTPFKAVWQPDRNLDYYYSAVYVDYWGLPLEDHIYNAFPVSNSDCLKLNLPAPDASIPLVRPAAVPKELGYRTPRVPVCHDCGSTHIDPTVLP